MTPLLQQEAERDRTPHYRSPRDLSAVPTEDLERIVEGLGKAVTELRGRGVCDTRPLLDGILDIEIELIRRLVLHGRRIEFGQDGPAQQVVRISHRSGGSGWAFVQAGA